MRKIYLARKYFKVSVLLFSFLIFACSIEAQTTILNGSTVAASTIPVNNSVTINAGGTLNMDAARTFASITTANAGTSTISGTNLLTVTGAVTIQSNNILSLNTNCNAASLSTNFITAAQATISGSGTLTSSGAVTINGGNSSGSTGNLTITSTVICTSILNGTGNKGHVLTISGVVKISTNATNIDNLTCNNGSTVEYNGGAAQTVYAATSGYSNLILSGSGAKALNGQTVNGILSMQGTATTSGTVNYGVSSTLEYRGSAAQTTGVEFVSPFPGSGGVIINNNNGTGVTLGSAKSIGPNPFTIGSTVSGSIFNDGGFQLTSTGTFNLTSGTFNIGSGASATAYPAFGTSNITAGTTVNYASTAAQAIVAVGYGNLTNTGNGARTLASSGIIGIKNAFTPSTNPSSTITGSTVSFNGTTAQTIPAFNYYNLTVTNTNTNITLANSGNIGIAGTFTPNATSFGAITNSTVLFNGTSAQAIPSFTFFNLQVNNPGGISSIGGDVTINQTLTLTNGVVATGGVNKMIMGNGGSVSRTNGWVNGNLQEYFSGSLLQHPFPVGDATTYHPVTITFSAVTTPGSITVTQLAGPHPQLVSSGLNTAKSVAPYWNLTSSGVVGTYNASFTFINSPTPGGDVPPGATSGSFIAREYNGSSWSIPPSSSTTLATTNATGLTTFGDFSIGETTGPPIINPQPPGATICAGNNTSFTSAATATPAAIVKWQRSLDNGITWVDITANLDAGVTYSTFTTNTLNLTGANSVVNGYKYRSVYTNVNAAVNSNPATLTITTPTDPTTSIDYPGSPFGSTVNTPQPPTQTGTTGGMYSKTAGAGTLSLNASTGDIIPSSSTPGAYIVTYTVTGTGGCPDFMTTASVTITLAPTAQISYTKDSFCIADNNSYIANITGTGNYTGGNYTAPGLVINATTGAFTPSANPAGTYTITYHIPASPPYPASTTTADITITSVPTATFDYTGGPFCTSDQSAHPSGLSGTNVYTGGLFTSSPSGLVLDPNTGDLTPSGSTGGAYTITYTIPAYGGCPAVPVNVTSSPVSIVTKPAASISYTAASFCQAITSASASISGTSGGTFSASDPNLIINTTTGQIDPSASIVGDYTVTYTIPPTGPCGQVQITTDLSIVASPSGTIDYPNQPYCQAGGVKSVTLNGTGGYSGGSFSSSPSGLTINGTGDIDPSSSSANKYLVTYTTPNCPVTFTTNVEIDAAPVATISYAGTPFCTSDGSSQPVTLTGDSSGQFSSTPGLSISNSGGINPSTSTPGTYTVKYTILPSGTCGQVVKTTSVKITALPTANISYTGTPFCISQTAGKSVTLSGTNGYTGGAFSAPSGVTINVGTGVITPNLSTAGSYTITYMTLASGGCAAVPATTPIDITALPAATISYGGPFCISDLNTYPVNYSATAGAYSGGTFTASPAGLSIDPSGNITPSASSAGTYMVTDVIPASSGCGAVTVKTSVTINADATIALTSAASTTSQTPCINAAIIPISYSIGGGGTGATVTGLPTNISGSYNSVTKVFTISGSANVSGPFSYIVTTTGPCGNNFLSGTININPNSTIALTSAAATTSQTPCINTPITDITSNIGGGGTGATFSGLPANVTGSFSGGIATIGGTPNGAGTYNFIVTTTGPCVNLSSGGTITVKPDASITLTSAAATTSQRPCINTAITPITYSISGGGTGATFSGLPANVTGGFSGGVVTISGTPNISGTFNYTVNTTGSCVQASASGVITVSSISVGGTASANQIICQGVQPVSLTLTGKTGTVVEWQKATDPNFTTTITHFITNSTTLPSATIGALSTTSYFRAVDTSGSCLSAFSTFVTIAVNPPFLPIINVSPSSTLCFGQSLTLSTTGFNARDTIIDGDFSDPKPTGWTGQNGNASNNNTNVDITWGYTNSGHTYAGKTYSSSGSSFMITNGDVTSILTTPPFSTIGRTALALQWNQGYSFNGTGSGKVEISINGGSTWTTLATYNSSSPIVSTNLFTSNPLTTINLSAYLGQPSVQIRYNFVGTGTTSTWAIDNVDVVGPYQPVTYTWPAGFTVSANGTSATITPPVGTTTYNISTATGGCASTTTSVTITVNPTPSITTQTATTCSGGSFSVTPANGGGNTVPSGTTYTWSAPVISPALSITGGSAQATAQSSISQVLTNTTGSAATATYTVTPLSGSCAGAPFTVTATVNALPAITTQPTPVTQAVCINSLASITVMATGTSLTYQWYSNSTLSNTGGTVISGANASTYNPVTTTSGTRYYYVVVSGTCSPSVTSNPATVTVTTVGTWLGVTSTDWQTATNWCGGIPTAATNVIIPVVSSGNYPLISNAHAVAASVNTTAGASLTMSGVYDLTLTSGAGFINNGTFTGTASTGAVVFAGSGTVAGTVNFKNVTINGAVDFGIASTVNGNLTINSGGAAAGTYGTSLVNYGAASTLIYNTTLTTGNEWYAGGSGTVIPGAGIPQNVTIQSGTVTIPNTGGSNRALAGNLLINSGSTLQMTSGSRDIYIAGNWTNSGGTFNANNRGVFFDGSNPLQTISGTTTFYNITLQNSVFFGTSISTIANTFSNSAGTMNGGTSTVIFTGNAGSIIGSNSKYFYNLQINSGANVTHTTGGGNIHIDNNYTNNGTYSEGANYTTYFDRNNGTNNLSGSGPTIFGNVTIGQGGTIGTGTTLNANGHSFTVSGTNFTFNHSSSTFNGGSSTVTFNGTSDFIGTGMSVTGTIAAFYGVAVLNTTTMGIDITVNGPLSIMNAANKLDINGNTLSLNGMVTGSGTIRGSSTSNITVGASGSVGTLYFDPTTGNLTNVLKDFKVNAGATATVGNDLNIVAGTLPGTVTANGTINSGNYLTLRSDINGTSRVASSLGSITGNVTVDRYIATGPSGGLNHGKSWQLIAVPTQGQTIKNAWQEGALVATGSTLGVIPFGSNPVPGYGTMLTSDIPGAKSQPTPGFDEYTTPGPSIKYYNPVANTYVGPLNTDVTPIYNQKGYFVFVRGDRSVNAFNQAANPTILRTKGTLFTAANPPFPTIVPVSANGFESVGNPYASAIDFRNVGKSANISLVFQVWDPRLGGGYNYGAFQTITYNPFTLNYEATPAGGSYGSVTTPNNFIQSGQAFFVQTTNPALTGTITFNENAKALGSLLVTSPVRTPSQQESLRIKLYSYNVDGTTGLVDGVLTDYDAIFSNGLDALDARKLTNTGENLSIKSSNQLLAVERRQEPTAADTMFLSLTGVRALTYRFELVTSNMNNNGLQGFLEDTYLNSRMPIAMNGTTYSDFSITNTPGSYNPNRFRIVFVEVNAGALPVTFTNVKATPHDNAINVEWQVENELNIKNYTVEKSADGIHFNTLGVTDATGNGGRSASYLVVDTNPLEGYNYYRVRSNDQDGKINLTPVVKAFMGSLKHDIVVNPNPITNGIITLQFLNMPAGKYAIRLFNKLGQVIMKKQITRMDGNNTETLKWNFNLAHGMYQLEITKPDNGVKSINVIY